MNDEAPGPTLAPERALEAERLLLAILGEPADLCLPSLWQALSAGNAGRIYQDLLLIIASASEDGYGDGYIDGRADERAEQETRDYYEEWE